MILRPYQAEGLGDILLAFAQGFRRVLYVLPTGGGKCLGRGTPVLMFDGHVKPVEDVQAGDLLMGPDSQPRTVTGLARGREELFQITPVKGEPYTVNASHILSLKMTGGSENSCGIPGGNVINIPVREYLIRNKTFRHCAKGWRVGVDFSESEEQLPIDPYFLGLWLGDGVSRGASITTGDCEIYEAVHACAMIEGLTVREELNSPGSVNLHLTKPELHPAGRGHHTNPLKNKLVALGLLQNKHIPHVYLTASRKDRLNLLAGVLDSDGYWSGKGFDLILKSKILFDGVVFLARSLGFAAYPKASRKVCCNNGVVGNYWRCNISGPVDEIPTQVHRNKAAPRKQKKDVLVTGISAMSLGEGDYFGFEIDGPDRLFLLGDFTVTHNTVLFDELLRGWSGPALAVAHRKELIRQAARSLGDVPYGIISPWAKRNDARIQIGSIQTLARRTVRPFSLIVVDEGHHSASATWRKFLDSQPDAFVLGVTATPARLDGRGLGEFFDHMIVGPSTGDLIGAGYLKPWRGFAPPVDVDFSKLRTLGGDYNPADVSAAFDKAALIGDTVAHYERHTPDQAALTFCASVGAAEHEAQGFRDRGWKFVCVHGGLEDNDRDDRLQGLAEGLYHGLTSCDLISEGLDVPAVSSIILRRPTQSLGRYLQMCGRGFRIGGAPLLTILDHAGNLHRHGLPDDEREWSLEGKKRKDGVRVAVCACPVCYAAHRPAPCCPACGHEYPKIAKVEALTAAEGDLEEVARRTASDWKPGRTLADEIAECVTWDDIEALRKSRNYRPGWSKYVWKGRRVRPAAQPTSAAQDFAGVIQNITEW